MECAHCKEPIPADVTAWFLGTPKEPERFHSECLDQRLAKKVEPVKLVESAAELATTLPAPPPSVAPEETPPKVPALLILKEDSVTTKVMTISASEVAAIIGEDPYRTHYDVFAAKVLGIRDNSDSYIKKRGHALEPLLVEEVGTRHKVRAVHNCNVSLEELGFGGRRGIIVRNNQWTLRHSDKSLDWMTATPDGACPDEKGGIECKVVGVYVADRWSDEIGNEVVPFGVLAQAQWQMSVCGWDHAYIVAGVDGEGEPRIARVEHDADLEGALIETVSRYRHDHLIARVPPPVDGSPASGEFLKKLYPRIKRKDYEEATGVQAALVRAYLKQKEENAAAEAALEVTTTLLKAQIGELEGIKGPGFWATWSESRGSVSWKDAFAHFVPNVKPEELEAFRGDGHRSFSVKAAQPGQKKKGAKL